MKKITEFSHPNRKKKDYLIKYAISKDKKKHKTTLTSKIHKKIIFSEEKDLLSFKRRLENKKHEPQTIQQEKIKKRIPFSLKRT